MPELAGARHLGNFKDKNGKNQIHNKILPVFYCLFVRLYYFLNFLLIKGTIPIMPEPRRSMVVGSGTGWHCSM